MNFIEIFTLVSGVIYIILEIRQKNLMWILGIMTSLASMWVFFRQGLYASFGLNTYYLIVSFIGLRQWRMFKKRTDMPSDDSAQEQIVVNPLGTPVVLISLLAFITGLIGLSVLMEVLENPMSWLDSAVAVLSAIATWWLVKAYLQQWLLWIAADLLSVVLCLSQGMWWMSALYILYTLSAVYGLHYWRQNGRLA